MKRRGFLNLFCASTGSCLIPASIARMIREIGNDSSEPTILPALLRAGQRVGEAVNVFEPRPWNQQFAGHSAPMRARGFVDDPAGHKMARIQRMDQPATA